LTYNKPYQGTLASSPQNLKTLEEELVFS